MTPQQPLSAEALAAMEARAKRLLSTSDDPQPASVWIDFVDDDAPALLAEVRRLTAALDTIREAVDLPATATTAQIVAAAEEQAVALAGWESTQ